MINPFVIVKLLRRDSLGGAETRRRASAMISSIRSSFREARLCLDPLVQTKSAVLGDPQATLTWSRVMDGGPISHVAQYMQIGEILARFTLDRGKSLDARRDPVLGRGRPEAPALR